MADGPPQDFAPEDHEQLKDQIFALWSANKDDKYLIGQKLAELQDIHAKPGYGTFLKDLEEMDIPQNTAYERIRYYRRIEAQWERGYDVGDWPVRLRPYRNGKDNFPVDDLDELDAQERAAELQARKHAADLKRTEIDRIIKAEAEKIEHAKLAQRTKVSKVNISLLLAPSKQEKFKLKWRRLEEKLRSKLIFKAVMDADTH